MIDTIKRFSNLLRPYRTDDGALLEDVLGSKVFLEEERMMERELRSMLIAVEDQQREEIYRECYERIHKWAIKNASGTRDGIYIKSLEKKLKFLKSSAICKIIGQSKKVLDIGCGDGALSIILALLGNEVTGIDVSPTVLGFAEENKRRVNITDVRFKCMSATNLGFPDEHFDVVISIDLIEHLHPKDLMPHLIQVNRILRRGGYYLISTPNRLSCHNIPLHLKEYTYAELTWFLAYAGLYCRSILFNPNARILPILLVPTHVKIVLEKFHSFLKRIQVFWTLASLDCVTILATKPLM